jgi:hypothetical protein
MLFCRKIVVLNRLTDIAVHTGGITTYVQGGGRGALGPKSYDITESLVLFIQNSLYGSGKHAKDIWLGKFNKDNNCKC